jgi:shikimate kinase
MKNKGLVVYVNLQESVLFERLSKAKKIRPSIVGMDEKQLKEFISNQLKARMPFYEQADLSMSGLSINVNEIVEKIAQFAH